MTAGAAKVDITPVGDVWMDGMVRSHKSVGVHDPLYARALHISPGVDPGDGFVIVSVDVCALKPEFLSVVRLAAQTVTGVPSSSIVIAATHTHSGPAAYGYFNDAETGYVDDLAEKLVAVIKDAFDGAQPAAVGCASGREDTISHYRRLLADDGRVVMNWEPYPPERIVRPLGEVDPEVGVLKVVSTDGKPICLLFNHAGHPNVLSGDNYLISADYPGLAAKLLEDEFGGVAMFINGAQGTMDIDGLRDRDFEGMDRIGHVLQAAVSKTVGAIEPSDQPIRCASIRYEMPSRKITEAECDWAQGILARTGGTFQPMADGVGDDYKALLYQRLRESQDRDILVEQSCIAIGDTAFISFPGELFTEIGMRIKADSPFKHTYILGLANGCVGYVPTRDAVSQGGYEVDTRPADVAAEDIVVRQSLGLLTGLHRVIQEE